MSYLLGKGSNTKSSSGDTDSPRDEFDANEAFKPWQYGHDDDEGSLYSIPEDSREDAVSDVHSKAGSSAALPRFGVELSFLDDPKHKENHNFKKTKAVVATGDVEGGGADVSREDKASDSDGESGDSLALQLYQTNIQWKPLLLVSLLWMILLGIAIAVAVTQINKCKDKRLSLESSIIDDPEPVPAPPPNSVPAPTVSPDLSVTEGYVYSALSSCKGEKSFFNTSTASGQIFGSLVDEVYHGLIKDTGGKVEFNSRHGVEYLKEKYALSMLYNKTNGASWSNKMKWLSQDDPCSWYGVGCQSRFNGSCAVRSLDLDNNNLSGVLPKELCCMPCLESINMTDNQIGGPVLTCLADIQTLEEVDFFNNYFTASVTKSSP